MTDQSRPSVAPPGWEDPRPSTAPDNRWRRALPLLLWLGCLSLAVALLVWLGDGRLAAPRLSAPGSWRAWAAGRDPVEVAMVVFRLFALGCAWYLTGVTSISVVARVLRAARLVRLADALSVGPVKHVVQQAVGIGLAAGVLATAVPAPATTTRAAAGPRDSDLAVMRVVGEDEGTVAALGDPTDEDVGDEAAGDASAGEITVPVMVPIPALRPASPPTAAVAPPATSPSTTTGARSRGKASTDAPTPDRATTASPGAGAGGAGGGAGPEQPDPAARREVRVRAGDHFWALAEQAVAEHLGRPGTDNEVVAQWQATLTANADRLVVAGNPDLLVPGQLVVLPAVEEVLP